MITFIEYENEIEEQTLFRVSRIKNRGRKIECETPADAMLAINFNAAHRRVMEIDGQRYVPLDSDNMNRCRAGEVPRLIHGLPYLPERCNG